MIESLTPNRIVSKKTVRLIITGQVALFVVLWLFATPAIIPTPLDVLQSFGDLWSQGLVSDLYTSLILYFQALILSTVLSLFFAYAASLQAIRPLTEGWAKLRFFGMVGLPFLLTICIRGVHELKLALLTFSISVFLTTSILDILDQIPKEKYDLARTLRMNDWQVLWEVQVLGRIDMAFDAIRQNAAIGWMMLIPVESLWKSEGGIGVMIDVQYKHFHLSEIVALQLIILILGLFQDYLFGAIKQICCPYSSMLLERR